MNSEIPESFPLADEYFQAVQRPADVVYDFRKTDRASDDEPDRLPRPTPLFSLCETSHAAKLAGLEDAIVIPNLWSPEECEAMIRTAETEGIIPPKKEAGTLRTAKRTDNYTNPSWSDAVAERIGDHLSEYYSKQADTEDDKYYGAFRSIHANWRVVRYDAGDTFPAHQDQMDSMQEMDPTTGRKDLIVSTHTLLVQLSPNPHEYQGGATRFYPRTKVAGKSPGQYDYAVDIRLPQGWALVFPQLGMVHAGQPVLAEDGGKSKYIAQAGILRTLPPRKLFKPSIFRLGPGLRELALSKGVPA